jgi:hypothetical protein
VGVSGPTAARSGRIIARQGFDVSAAQNNPFPGIRLNGQWLTVAPLAKTSANSNENKESFHVTLEESLILLT